MCNWGNTEMCNWGNAEMCKCAFGGSGGTATEGEEPSGGYLATKTTTGKSGKLKTEQDFQNIIICFQDTHTVGEKKFKILKGFCFLYLTAEGHGSGTSAISRPVVAHHYYNT